MKLAEALILRADLKKRTAQLNERLNRNVRVQEGDEPAESPEELLREFDRIALDLESLIRSINWTNSNVPFDAERRISDAIAVRDTLDLRIRTMRHMIDQASERDRLFTRSEVKFVPTVNARELQKQLDALSQQRRELDTRLQELNWQVELLER